ncbi:MAG TPA: dephospho-CoA kinase [Flavobacteriaceae bacterium]|nr:dephospho-CoA kinase [Flavobacteriaceae bacterium]
MIVVGLTGGIGSGKTTVANKFKKLGVPVYISDEEAKALMHRSKVIKRKLIALFGEKAYLDGKLNRAFIASAVFNNKTLLEQMNAIVHPKVGQHFKRWLKKQSSFYVIKESAILFESNAYKSCDLIITVSADEELRIKRVMQRDKVSREQVLERIKNQWPEAEKIARSNYVIHNHNLEDLERLVASVHNEILNYRG